MTSLKKQKQIFSTMMKWLNDNGATFPNLSIKHYSHLFRGVVANKFIAKDKTIVTIPFRCIMNVDKAKKTRVGKEIEEMKFVPESEHTWLALFLLNEKMNMEESFWKPYLKSLPLHYSNFPLFFGKNTLKKMKGSLILDMIKSRKIELEEDFKKIKNALPDFTSRLSEYVTKQNKDKSASVDSLMLKEYTWARIAVISRIFGSDTTGSGLVPFSDMLNHAETPGTHWDFVKSKNAFVIRTTKNFMKSCEIFDTYGGKCNSRYLVNYGFTLPHNSKYNTTALFFDVKKILDSLDKKKYSQKLMDRKLDFLVHNNSHFNVDDGYSGYSMLIQKNKEAKCSQQKKFRFQVTTFDEENKKYDRKSLHQIPYKMFNFIRMLLLHEDEWEYFMYTLSKTKETLPPIFYLDLFKTLDYKRELEVLRILKEHCESRLLEFRPLTNQTSRQEYLRSLEEFSTQWNIANMLLGERDVLTYYIDMANVVLQSWEETKDIKKVCKILKQSPYKSYKNMFVNVLNE